MKDYLDAFPEILRYGVTGLSALVFYFTFLLLKQQNEKSTPDNSMLQTIKYFMGIAVILAVISLVDAGLRSGKGGSKQHSIDFQKKVSLKGTIKNDKSGLPMDNAEIYLVPATGNDLAAITDDQGKFVFDSVPDKTCWSVFVRYNKSDAKSSGKGMLELDKIIDTVYVYGAKIDYQKYALK